MTITPFLFAWINAKLKALGQKIVITCPSPYSSMFQQPRVKDGVDKVTIYLPITATPVFVPVAGTFVEQVTVALSCATLGNTIYYSTDGSPPRDGTKYIGPFVLSGTTTVKAIAIAAGHTDSVESLAIYTLAPSP